MNICSSAELDWIERDGLNKEDVKKILTVIHNKEQDIKNPIFYRLLKNYVSDIPPVPKYKFLLGCSSVIYLVSRKYDKKILLLGDIHIPHNFKNTKTNITATSYFEKYLKSNTKLIDFFIETAHTEYIPQKKPSELTSFEKKFRKCYYDRNCSFRFHAVDLRKVEEKDKVLDVLMHIISLLSHKEFTQCIYHAKSIEHIGDIYEYISSTLINKIPLRKEIDKIKCTSLKRQVENFYLNYPDSHLKIDSSNLILRLKELKKNPSITQINALYLNLFAMTDRIIETYTLARIFKRVEGLYNPEPKYIVVFQGDAHIQKLLKFFKDTNEFEVKFSQTPRTIRIANISSLPQPIFE